MSHPGRFLAILEYSAIGELIIVQLFILYHLVRFLFFRH